jgi:hypothetical protein
LANIALQYSQGTPLDKAFSQARPPVWDKRKPLMSKALQRYSAQRWAQLLAGRAAHRRPDQGSGGRFSLEQPQPLGAADVWATSELASGINNQLSVGAGLLAM